MSTPERLHVDLVAVTGTTTVPVPDPLTINGIPAWRAKTAKMPTGVAAACSSDMFKSPV
jgi:aromatic amino acid aminotransferase I